MLVRLWRATVLPGREAQYDEFARTVSRPMFEQQAGFQGVFFARDEERCLVITLWKDRESVAALAASGTYADAVERIRPLIGPDTTTETYEVDGGVVVRGTALAAK